MGSFNDINPSLINCIVCYVDILGFTKMVVDSCNESISKGNNLLVTLNDVITNNEYKLTYDSGNSKIKIFTDNIISAFPISPKNNNVTGLHELLDAIERYGLYQFRLSIEGFFIRGGISYGKHYMNDKIVFGPALIESHLLESEIARDARIVLSKKISDTIVKKAFEQNKTRRIRKYILLDYDNMMFINYLGVVYEKEKEKGTENSFISMLNKHKEAVSKKLIEFKSGPKVLSKYIWVGHYHNQFCNINFKEDKSLRISSVLLKVKTKTIRKSVLDL